MANGKSARCRGPIRQNQAALREGLGRKLARLRCWPTTPRRKWTRCWSTTGQERRRTPRRPAPSRLRCWPTTPRRRWTRCWPTTGRRARRTQTQAAIAGALLAYRTGPDQDVFTTNQITLALVAHRSAADQDTATASSIAAALLSYYTVTQTNGLLAGKLGVTEAANSRALSG